MPDDFNAAEFGLRRCHVRVVEGLIFICLGPQPPDREKTFREWERYFRQHKLAEAKIATARFFTQRVMPQSSSLFAAIMAGGRVITEIEEQAL